MARDDERPIRRRRFLQAVGAAGAVGLAGCSGGGDGGDGDGTTTGTTEGTTDGMDDGTTTETTTEETTTETTTETPEPASGRVTLVHDTHFHGNLGSLDDPGNVANYFGLIDRIRSEHPDALVLGNGDDLHTSLASSVFGGSHIVDAFNAGGLDYDAYGNHEFDLGPESLAENVADSEFTWLSANVVDSRTGDAYAAEEGARRWTVHEQGDVSVGLFGLAPADTPNVTSVGENVEVLDPVEAAREAVGALREEADVIVLQSHVGNGVAERIAREVDGLDAVVGDHEAAVLEEPRVVDDTVLSFVGDEFEFLGELHLDVEAGSVAGHEFRRHELASEVEAGLDPHPEVEDLVEGFQSDLDERLGEEIGRTETELDVRERVVRRQESNFGNYVADVIREGMDADVALQNGGGIRSDTTYGPGTLTRRDIVNVLPFPNDTVTVELTGAELRDAVEHGVAAVGDLDGRFPQVSGMHFAYDPARDPGDRVTELRVGGEPVAGEETYAVATNDFMAGGGDGYDVLAEAEVLVPAAEGQRLSVAVIDAIVADGTIAPEVEGRITVQAE